MSARVALRLMPLLRRSRRMTLGIVILAATTASSALGQPQPLTLRLNVDADRDGRISDADAPGKGRATAARGAMVLPNIDDDAGRCPGVWRAQRQQRVTMDEAAACSDAQTPIVDPGGDERDLAPIEVAPIPEATDDTTLVLRLDGVPAGKGRLHFARQQGAAVELRGDQLRRGATVLVEALDIARDAAEWDGTLAVAGVLTRAGESAHDRVVLHVAPVRFASSAADAVTLYASQPRTEAEIRTQASRQEGAWGSGRTRRWLRDALAENRYLRRLDSLATRAVPLHRIASDTPWMQDQFETGIATVPTSHGPNSMRVTIVAQHRVEYGPVSGRNPAIVQLVSRLRAFVAPGRGVIVPPVGPTPPWEGGVTTELDVSGALEATPAVVGAPFGKVLLSDAGKPRHQPTFAVHGGTAALLGAQIQPLVRLPTGWLDVGHVDEVLSFVPAATGRGWALVLSDPAAALRVLAAAARRSPNAMLRPPGLPPVRARAVLDGPIGKTTRAAAARVEEIEATLRSALHLGTDDEAIIRVPVLFRRAPRSLTTPKGEQTGLEGYPANTVNGLHITGRRFLAPAPHGPLVGGVDALQDAARRAFRAKGVRVRFVETSPMPHLHGGELHCTTNAERVFATLG